ncbi:MAG: hypothetical protein IVW56_09725 [Candidatus Binataceae bacterium]|nr:hypothetical protein [Candidatus Binataceae bacterium]MBF6560558.1 hypothetical protein [Candidatus Binataceae bacterium]
MAEPVVDDFDAIRLRICQLRSEAGAGRPCHARLLRPMAECWCYGAGPGGLILPCPPPRIEVRVEPAPAESGGSMPWMTALPWFPIS